jgi:hypothetical protein
MVTLEPVARDKAREKEEKDAANREAARKFDRVAGGDPDKIEEARKEPDPKMKERNKRIDAVMKKEHRRLIREARRSQS